MFILKESVAFHVNMMKAFRVLASLNINPCSRVAYSCLGGQVNEVGVCKLLMHKDVLLLI